MEENELDKNIQKKATLPSPNTQDDDGTENVQETSDNNEEVEFEEENWPGGDEKDSHLKNSESASKSGDNIIRDQKPASITNIKKEDKPAFVIHKPEPQETKIHEMRPQEAKIQVPTPQPVHQARLNKFVDINDWLQKIGWRRNPFNFTIEPSLFVGYADQKNMLLRAIEEGHKLILVSGPTGSGKTTMLKWVTERLGKDYKTIFLGKPPDVAERFIDILNYEFRAPWLFRPFMPHIKNMYQIPGFLNKKLKGKCLVVLCDEIHESDMKVLEWMRVLSDHIDNVTVVLSGLPVFESYLNGLETFKKRIIERIELLSLTKEETAKLIETRIKNSGGRGDEFADIIDIVYERTQGFPREVLRYCNSVLDEAVKRNETVFRQEMLEFTVKKELSKTAVAENLTPMQRRVLELLKVPMTPGGLADMLDLGKYKTRQHAVRSVNNILKVLMDNDYVERSKDDKAYLYALAPRVRTLFVKS